MSQSEGLRRLQSIIEEVLLEVGPKIVEPDVDTIKRYCESIGESNPVYFDGDAAKSVGYRSAIVPQAYLLSLFTPIVNEFFVKGFERLFSGLIRGVIHTESRVVYYKPLFVGEKYVLRLESVGLEKKSGKKGDYYVWTLRTVVSNEEEKEDLAYDQHTFFLKI
ncbi:MAG: MaoC family dehydratase N-terminal domain-containing protein [Candidatus Freyarchaeota archaeon]|nr:MaoC family dehydratase N-terminal domain-containing protein [Candidatus Jordarchaeia archaeon]MBS7269771.1 MaoC family dehydratase N-terminal domain-containing protein [Candidatus Jordarchaeia archaeon]MBS7280340.1 MaoC family dehydratase N-terminal domain-containing protein [Candidatus Jordarchaeia archaeon]